MIKQKWQQFTMALGLWLIGGRETPHIKKLQESLGNANDAFWAAERLRGYTEIQRDEHYAKIKDLQVYLDGSNEQYEILYKKYNRLKRQNRSLRDKLDPPVKRKAKKKRV